MLSSMTSLASETKEIVAEFEIAPPFGASFRLQSEIQYFERNAVINSTTVNGK